MGEPKSIARIDPVSLPSRAAHPSIDEISGRRNSVQDRGPIFPKLHAQHKLDSNCNNIGVRSVILYGAPISTEALKFPILSQNHLLRPALRYQAVGSGMRVARELCGLAQRSVGINSQWDGRVSGLPSAASTGPRWVEHALTGRRISGSSPLRFQVDASSCIAARMVGDLDAAIQCGESGGRGRWHAAGALLPRLEEVSAGSVQGRSKQGGDHAQSEKQIPPRAPPPNCSANVIRRSALRI